ncbi:MAG: tetratricopeptide repeat protein [Maribacter sp.]|nr:tetratricopeptide repeat protein [Maribacter sp.]
MGFLKYGFFIVFFFVSQLGTAQSISDPFKEVTDSLVNAEPRTYAELDAVLRPFRKDTILMQYFLQEAVKKDYYAGQSYAFNHMGRTYRDISLFSRSLELHQKALETAERGNSLEFRIYSHNMLSTLFRKTESIQSALDHAQGALQLAETIKNPSKGIKRSINVSLNSIGNIYKALGQYELAIAKFEESMNLERELDNDLGLAINLQNIGECYEAVGRLEEALQNYATSLAHNEKIGSERGKIICNYSIAHVYVHQGEINKALDILEEAITTSKVLGDKGIIASVYINLGWTLIHHKRYKEAETNLLNGLEISRKFNLPSVMEEALRFLSDLKAAQGDFKESLKYFKNSYRAGRQISNDRNLRYVADMISRYDTEKKSNELEALAKENEIVKLKLLKKDTSLLIGGFALALLAGIFYILYRQYQLKNDKKLLTLEQTMLRSQMNPHFLFNSLNSIKLYIINNEKKNAVHYLNKFSKLVRKILEASSLKEIPLAEELETVELYMNIENIRFSNEINFNISIDEGIDVHTIKIPSLILQPFLENALWHGLSSKEGGKNIDLDVSKGKNNFINISISDNGVGRAAAEIIKESKILKRKSIGIAITKERLANFSRDYQNTFDFTIIDLYDEKGNAIGTKVVLHIPTI